MSSSNVSGAVASAATAAQNPSASGNEVGQVTAQEPKGAQPQTNANEGSDPPPDGYTIGGAVELRSHKTKQWISATIKSYSSDLGGEYGYQKSPNACKVTRVTFSICAIGSISDREPQLESYFTTKPIHLFFQAFEIIVNGTGVVESGVPLGLIRHASAAEPSRKKSKSGSTEKAKRRANKRKRKLLAAINEILGGFNEKELQASLQIVQALGTISPGEGKRIAEVC